MVDIVDEFIKDEYTTFPVMSHDDMLDCLARIEDPDVNIRFPAKSTIPLSGARRKKVGWMAA